MAGNIPRDVMEQLLAAGVKFDEQGNIIDDDNEFIIDDEDGDEDDDNLNQDDADDENDDLEDSDDEDEDSDDEDDEDEDDEDDEPVPPKKRKKAPKSADEDPPKKPLLTPREVSTPKTEDNDTSEIAELKKNIQQLLAKHQSNTDDNNTPGDREDEISSTLTELRREAQQFRQMRSQQFANDVKKRVNDSNYGVSFNEIIASKQWDEFLNSRAYGQKISDLYKQSILDNDADAVLFFFEDFASKYLKSSNKEGQSVKQDDLDDLAVPDKTKANKAPKKRNKYDFEEEDYIRKLDEVERGRISREEFFSFEKKFELALSKGRVKPSR